MAERAASFVAECYWPDVTDADLETRDRLAADATAELKRRCERGRHLGLILVRVKSKKEKACARP